VATLIPNGRLNATYVVTHDSSPRPYTFRLGHVWDTDVGLDVVANVLFGYYVDSVHDPRAHTVFDLARVDVVGNSGGSLFTGTSDNPPQSGTRSNAIPPSSVCALATKRTASFGRQFRGRMYLPGCIAEVEVDEVGTLTSAWLTAQQAALNAWHEQLQDIVVPFTEAPRPVLLHSDGGDGGFLPGGTSQIITQFLARTYIGTQRRRLLVG
jgi:hypothetical protein